MAGQTRTFTFAFDPDPEGGFVVTCPALPGLVTHGATLEEARSMARDAMEGYIEVLLEDGEAIPESDRQPADPRGEPGKPFPFLRYDGPRKTIEDMKQAIMNEVRARHARGEY